MTAMTMYKQLLIMEEQSLFGVKEVTQLGSIKLFLMFSFLGVP